MGWAMRTTSKIKMKKASTRKTGLKMKMIIVFNSTQTKMDFGMKFDCGIDTTCF